jgi:dinuclear metal center YbgI/SA1388 family protein
VSSPRLAEVTAALDVLYPRALAEPWDAVGLACGDPDAPVARVHFAIDPVQAVVDEAIALGADLLVTHHPLYLRGTTTVAADRPKGRVVHALVGAGCGLFVAHTNADKATGGVNDALAALLGLTDTGPLPGGLGRIGSVDPMTTADLTRWVAQRLPSTSGGVKASGDPACVVRRLAVCGGAGDDLFAAAVAAGADAYLTADLRHHVTSEAPEGLVLLDASHWATEWPWLSVAAQALARVVNVQTSVSALCTDPWTTASRSNQA